MATGHSVCQELLCSHVIVVPQVGAAWIQLVWAFIFRFFWRGFTIGAGSTTSTQPLVSKQFLHLFFLELFKEFLHVFLSGFLLRFSLWFIQILLQDSLRNSSCNSFRLTVGIGRSGGRGGKNRYLSWIAPGIPSGISVGIISRITQRFLLQFLRHFFRDSTQNYLKHSSHDSFQYSSKDFSRYFAWNWIPPDKFHGFPTRVSPCGLRRRGLFAFMCLLGFEFHDSFAPWESG